MANENTTEPKRDPLVDEVWKAAISPYLEILKKLEIPGGRKVDPSDLGIWYLLSPLFFESKKSASEARKALDACVDKLRRFHHAFKHLNRLNPSIVRRMESHSDAIFPAFNEEDEPDLLPRREEHRSYENLLTALGDELAAEKARVAAEIEERWTGIGRGKKWEAREIAISVARIYHKIRGKVPTFGTKPDSNEPSTDFGRAVRDILKLRGITAGFGPPCQAAIELLNSERP